MISVKDTSKDARQIRTHAMELRTASNDTPVIEGYFAVFNSNYEICDGYTESIAPGAFTDTLRDDVKALIDHDTALVLGRTTAGTLKLREDEKGLWGHIDINTNDFDAMNLYERVRRGDVDQCSFGFIILDEETEVRADGSVHWTIKKVRLFEVSVCTFPAYEATSVEARKADAETVKNKINETWRSKMRKRLKGGKE